MPTFTMRTIVRAVFIIALFTWGIAGARHYEAFNFLHGVDLLIHEFGHPFFSIFGGTVLTALGGTLAQLIMPGLFLGYFLLRKEYYNSAVVMFWVGQNFFDIAVYMRDARALALPLIGIGGGDDTIGHDWNYLFAHWGVLHQDLAIANVTACIGWLFFLASLGVGLYYADVIEQPAGNEEEPVNP